MEELIFAIYAMGLFVWILLALIALRFAAKKTIAVFTTAERCDEDRTGLGTVRDAVLVMQESGVTEMEMAWKSSEDKWTNVELKITRS